MESSGGGRGGLPQPWSPGGSSERPGDRLVEPARPEGASIAAAGRRAGSASLSLQEDEDGGGGGWRDPAPHEQMGGYWLVGKPVRVYWEDDERCNPRFPLVLCVANALPPAPLSADPMAPRPRAPLRCPAHAGAADGTRQWC